MDKEINTVKIVVSNIGLGPRGVNTMSGTVMIERGAVSPELLVSAGELVSLKTNETLVVQEKGAGETVMRGRPEPRLSKMGEQIKALEARLAKLEDSKDNADLEARLAKLETATSPDDDSAGKTGKKK